MNSIAVKQMWGNRLVWTARVIGVLMLVVGVGALMLVPLCCHMMQIWQPEDPDALRRLFGNWY